MKNNENFAFVLDSKERQKVNQHTIAEDHITFRVSGCIIAVLQLFMLISNLIEGVVSERSLPFRYLYIFLLTATVIFLFALEYIYKRSKRYTLYYAVTALYMFCVFIWAAGISFYDCQFNRDLSTFAYATIACVAVMVPEPWIVAFESIICTAGLNLIMLNSPSVNYHPGMLTQSLSICILANVVALMCYNRRIRRIRLEFANTAQMEEIQKLNDKLKDDAYFDALTGIHNRRYLTEHIDTVLNIGEFSSGVIMLDIDFFKKFNDTYGHQNGDECLKHIGYIIREFIGESAYAVRYGGEEFLLFYESITEMELADKAESLRERIESNPVRLIGGKRVNITASIGYANATKPVNLSELIGIADKNLYSAKENGRNRIFPGNTITPVHH